jgi:hypothetical protein
MLQRRAFGNRRLCFIIKVFYKSQAFAGYAEALTSSAHHMRATELSCPKDSILHQLMIINNSCFQSTMKVISPVFLPLDFFDISSAPPSLEASHDVRSRVLFPIPLGTAARLKWWNLNPPLYHAKNPIPIWHHATYVHTANHYVTQPPPPHF